MPCYTDSLCLPEYTKMKATIFRREKVEMISTFQRNRNFRKLSVNKTFTHLQEQKKATPPDIPLTFRIV